MTQNPFQRFHALGYNNLTPVIPPDAQISANSTLYKRVGTSQDARGKVPGRRNHDGTWGSFDWVSYQADEQDYVRWADMGAGVGIKTGDQGDGTWLIAIDADLPNPQHAAIAFDEVNSRINPLWTRIGQHPKALYLVRVSAEFIYRRIDVGDEKDRVELLSDRKFFVAEGIHRKTGKLYEWPGGVPAYADIPIVTPGVLVNMLEAMRQRLPASEIETEGGAAPQAQGALKGDLEAVRRAVRATPNNHNTHPSRESYRDVGYAIKAALPDHPDEALELFHEWSQGWESPSGDHNDPDVVDADWRRMKGPFRRGASWLFDQAAALGTDYDRADAWFEEQPIDLFAISTGEDGESAPKDPQKRLTLVPFAAAADEALTSSTKPLVKGLLDQGTLSVMYGPSNVGKTFVAMDVAFHIASGMPWGGLKTSRGAVVYVAAEGGSGAKKRAEALRRRYPKQMDGLEFHLLLSNVDLLRPDADLKPLILAILDLGLPVVMVVLDTLARVMAGGEENGSTDMGTMIKHFDVIRRATGAHVMIVHHAGKNQAAGARGHSSLRAATDTEIEIAEGQILVTKQRDLEKSYQSAFRLDVVTLGQDDDGDAITSCTVALVPRIEAAAGAATPTEQFVLDALCVAVSALDEGKRGAKIGEVLDVLSGQSHGMEAETCRAHLKNLAKKNLAGSPARGFWTPKSGNSDYKNGGVFYEVIPEEKDCNRNAENSGVFD